MSTHFVFSFDDKEHPFSVYNTDRTFIKGRVDRRRLRSIPSQWGDCVFWTDWSFSRIVEHAKTSSASHVRMWNEAFSYGIAEFKKGRAESEKVVKTLLARLCLFENFMLETLASQTTAISAIRQTTMVGDRYAVVCSNRDKTIQLFHEADLPKNYRRLHLVQMFDLHLPNFSVWSEIEPSTNATGNYRLPPNASLSYNRIINEAKGIISRHPVNNRTLIVFPQPN